jgi:hypothetical protein
MPCTLRHYRIEQLHQFAAVFSVKMTAVAVIREVLRVQDLYAKVYANIDGGYKESLVSSPRGVDASYRMCLSFVGGNERFLEPTRQALTQGYLEVGLWARTTGQGHHIAWYSKSREAMGPEWNYDKMTSVEWTVGSMVA